MVATLGSAAEVPLSLVTVQYEGKSSMAYYRRRSGYRRPMRSRYGMRRRGFSRFRRGGYRRPYTSFRGRGRYRGRGRMSRQSVRLVIQTPTDMLPPRPSAGQFARQRRRARF